MHTDTVKFNQAKREGDWKQSPCLLYGMRNQTERDHHIERRKFITLKRG